MPSFFEKLKRGLGIENQKEKEEEKPGKSVELKVEEIPKAEEKGPVSTEAKGEKTEIKKEKWFESEGQLAVDVFQTENELVIQSAIAGVKPEKLDILIEQDVITMSGKREEPEEKGKIDYFVRECYFGPFSREIISPVEIDPNRAKAIMKDGILVIKIPKIQEDKKIKVEVQKE